MSETFSPAQLAQLEAMYRKVVREELADIGLRVDSPDHQEVAREDLRFLRRLRKAIDGTAAKVGLMVIAAVFGGLIWIVTIGIETWRATGRG